MALLYRPFTALILLIYVVVYQIVENYTLAPKISARTMQLHAGIAFAATIAGRQPVRCHRRLPGAAGRAILQAGVTTYAGRHEVLDTRLTEHDGDGGPGGADRSGAGGPDGTGAKPPGRIGGALSRAAGRLRRKKPPDGPADGSAGDGPAIG